MKIYLIKVQIKLLLLLLWREYGYFLVLHIDIFPQNQTKSATKYIEIFPGYLLFSILQHHDKVATKWVYLEVCHAGYILIKLKINNGSESKAVPMTVTYSKQLATMACYLSLNETLYLLKNGICHKFCWKQSCLTKF